jgi:hypothetical protein
VYPLKPRGFSTAVGTTEQAAEKLSSVEQNLDSSGLKALGMTRIKGLLRHG